MIRIRRYPNRRYYDRTRRRYVTLSDIEEFVRDGGTVEVHDSRNGDDLTRQVLAQILLERHPDRMEIFPPALLHSLLQANGFALEFWGLYLRQALHMLDELQHGVARALPLPMPLLPPTAWPPAFRPEPAEADAATEADADADDDDEPEDGGSPPAVTTPAIEPIGSHLERLDRRIGRLEGGKAGPAPAAREDVAGTLDRMEERVRGLEGRLRRSSS